MLLALTGIRGMSGTGAEGAMRTLLALACPRIGGLDVGEAAVVRPKTSSRGGSGYAALAGSKVAVSVTIIMIMRFAICPLFAWISILCIYRFLVSFGTGKTVIGLCFFGVSPIICLD